MESAGTELVPCHLCGSTRRKLLFADTVLAPDGTRGVVRCRQCRLVYRDIRATAPQALESYRDRRYDAPAEDWLDGRIRVFEPYAATLDRYRENGRILDVGAGHGFFLQMCSERDWECHGVEPSRECAAFAAERFGLRYDYATVEEADYPKAFFDVVTCWNVLDQLADPMAAVRRIHGLVRPGGIMLVRGPNAAFHVPARRTLRMLSRLWSRFGRLDQSVFHLHSFDRRTVSALLEAAGFAPVEVTPADLGWTTTHGADGRRGKRMVARAVAGATTALCMLTAGRILLAPSIVARAHRPARGTDLGAPSS